MNKAITTILSYADAVGNDDWKEAIRSLEKSETTVPPILAEMRRLIGVMRGLPAYEITDTVWHLDSMEEDLKALWDIHVEEPRRAEEAEQARHEDVMENGSHAERRHEVLGDES
jgi:hypothetical protein